MATKKSKKKKKSSKPKTSAQKKNTVKKAKTAKRSVSRKTAAKKTTRKKPVSKSRRQSEATFARRIPERRSDMDAGDLQGLSRREAADSESVDELVDEGNAFEADAVSGVEEAENADEEEVHTHEVLEDDVPEEYLDEE
jgi:hypothetical protein